MPATAAPPVPAGRGPRVRAGEWTLTGSLAQPRSGHTATRLRDGRVLVAGGVDFNGFGLATAELYDPAAGTWRSTGTMVQNRIGHTATLLLSGKVLVTAGHGGGNLEGGHNLRSCEIYDPVTGRWQGIHWLSTVRTSHTATLLPSGQVLVAGGWGDTGAQPVYAVELYDPGTGRWSALPDMPIPQVHTVTLLPSGRLLTAGGGGTDVTEPGQGGEPGPEHPELCQLFDPETRAWTRTGDLIVGRSGGQYQHTATLLKKGSVLVAGGRARSTNEAPGTDAMNRSETYDPAAGMWTEAGHLGQARAQHTATQLPDNTVLAVGGYQDGVGVHDSGERYVPRTRSWVPAGRMAQRRHEHTATLLTDGSVLVVGGYTERPRPFASRNPTATAELFTLGCRSQPR